ncbi:MAG: hypothetical protein AB7W59_16835 [Acidimicrobiia bacterium]
MTEIDPIEQAAIDNPAVQAGLEAAKEGRTKRRGRPAGVPSQAAEKGARFAPKLDADAKEALRKLAVLNSVGLAPTVDEITIGATDHASQQASRWVVAQYEKATASMKKIEAT